LSGSWPPGPSRPKPPLAEVHVWRADLQKPGWPPPETLPGAERERAEKMRRAGAGRRWTASRWALRAVLGRYLQERPTAVALRLGEHGKPELAERRERLSFNLSHAGGLALVAVAVGREVGLDVEAIEAGRDLLALAERGLEPAAAAAVRAAAPGARAAVFYEEWVRHEALVKCLGGGLGSPLPREPVTVSTLEIDRGYVAALAAQGRQAPICRRYSLRLGDDDATGGLPRSTAARGRG
jgi:4'-phosphopantetheinyl transferase